MSHRLRVGNIAKVKNIDEIITFEGNLRFKSDLVFMPEMITYFGKYFKVSENVTQATMDALSVPLFKGSYVREFKNKDVVFLEELRCSGENHGGC